MEAESSTLIRGETDLVSTPAWIVCSTCKHSD